VNTILQWARCVTCTIALAYASSARAERFEQLFAGAELRLRERHDSLSPPCYELTLPHGLHAPHGDLVARLGVVLPTRGALAFPVSVGLRYMPFSFALHPLLGADLGGYFSEPRGRDTPAHPGGLEWTWSVRALLGVHLALPGNAALQVYVDAAWSEPSEDPRSRSHVAGGYGGGCALSFAFPAPGWRPFRMLMRGEQSPRGW
jgi:hypothetical protein